MIISQDSDITKTHTEQGFWSGFGRKPDYISYDFIAWIVKPALVIFALLQVRNLAYQHWLAVALNLVIFFSLLIAVRNFRSKNYYWLMPLALGGVISLTGVVGSFFLAYDAALWIICATVTVFTTLHYRHAIVFAPLGFLLTMPQLYEQAGFATTFRFALINIFLMVIMYGFTRSMADHYFKALKESMTDSLTGLINRRAMIGEMDKWFQYSHRYPDVPLVLVMMDIDHFKSINDKQGHLAGDKVLKQFALKAKAFIRESDSLARYGGEEFLMLLPNTDEAGAEQLLAKLRGSLAYYQSDNEDALKFSAGITCLRGDDSIDSWLQRVDMAMYQAKAAGRNCSITV